MTTLPRPKQPQSINYNQILTVLRQKRERIEEAIITIERLANEEQGEAGRIPSFAGGHAMSTPAKAPVKKRTLSAAARKRISDATRKRWAAKRAQAAAKKTTRKQTAKKTE